MLRSSLMRLTVVRMLPRRHLNWEDAAARRMIKLWVAEKLGEVLATSRMADLDNVYSVT